MAQGTQRGGLRRGPAELQQGGAASASKASDGGERERRAAMQMPWLLEMAPCDAKANNYVPDCLYSSSKSEWELRELPIHCEEEDIGELLHWSTKQVVAFGTYFCWIDYKSGMLFCEVFREHLRFSYVKLPVSSSPL
ncbi:hypothetical protein EJB05_37402, partial [Eragrostis curvula]